MRTLHVDRLTADGYIFGATSAIGAGNVDGRLAVLDRLRPIKGERFIDLGCGDGTYSARLSQRATEQMTLLDIVPENIEAARRSCATDRIKWSYQVGSVYDTGLPAGQFDSAFMIEVIDHLGTPLQAMAEARRLLAPGGALYITAPNRPFPFETHPVRWGDGFVSPRVMPFLPWIPPLHRRLATAQVFTARGLRAMAREAGFSHAEFDYMMPQFERLNWPLARRLTALVADTPLKMFGVSLCAVFYR